MKADATIMSHFARGIMQQKYSHKKRSGHLEEWPEIAERTVSSVMGGRARQESLNFMLDAVTNRQFLPGGRYLYASGRPYPQVNNCFLYRAHDSREGWAETSHDSVNSLMTGGGIGVVYSLLRGAGSYVRGMGGTSTGPIALMNIINESGRYIMQGGTRRSAIWAGLHWNHPDIMTFIELKNWPKWLREKKAEDFNTPAPMDMTNISVILDDAFFHAYYNPNHHEHKLAHEVYWKVVRQMMKTGEPGFSVDIGGNAGEHLRNACTEVTSSDNGDVCNLGSVNMARVNTIEQFEEVCRGGVDFLLNGSMYSVLPLEKMVKTREKNRRIGLGLMGVHEWLLKRGYSYGPCSELDDWLEVYQQATGMAHELCDQYGISRSVATRAVAPTGTISIIAETTSGLEPIYTVAFKRRYLKGTKWHYQHVVDATAKRLIKEHRVDPQQIEDSMDLAGDPDKRMRFQAQLQKYVDHGISSTINLPAWGSLGNNDDQVKPFGTMLLKHLPNLRGITVYPDGARGGQPLTKVPYEVAVADEGTEYEETGDKSCAGGVCYS